MCGGTIGSAQHGPVYGRRSGKPPEVQLQIQLDDDVANGQYVNMALVNHTETEFTLDFIYVQPQQPKAQGARAHHHQPQAHEAAAARDAGQPRQVRSEVRPDRSTDPENPVDVRTVVAA